MLHLVSNLIGAVAAGGLILSALVYMVSPQRGGEMLRRLAIFLAGALIGACLLRQFAACIHLRPSLLLLGIGISVAAYFLRECRKARPKQSDRSHRPERTPGLPHGGSRT
jgi:hypothetical protein